MAKVSAGLLMYRKTERGLEVLLVHPGGPYWRKKGEGAWSIPKGEVNEGEDLLEAAKREFEEETGYGPPQTNYRELGTVKLKSGKTIHGWATEGNIDADNLKSIEFEVEWPPRSGKKRKFPEADRAGWFSPEEARRKIHPGQAGFLNRISP